MVEAVIFVLKQLVEKYREVYERGDNLTIQRSQFEMLDVKNIPLTNNSLQNRFISVNKLYITEYSLSS